MSKDYRVNFTADEAKQRLEKVFKPEHKELMSQCIMEMIGEDTRSIEALIKASLGVKPQIDYLVDEIVLVRKDYLSTWRFAEKEMEEKYILESNDKYLKCKIEQIRPFAEEQYTVKYKYFDKDDPTKVNKTTSKVPASSMLPYEELPGD